MSLELWMEQGLLTALLTHKSAGLWFAWSVEFRLLPEELFGGFSSEHVFMTRF